MRTIKRLLYLFITFCFIVCLMPIATLADNDTQSSDVGEENEVLVESLTVFLGNETANIIVGDNIQLLTTILPAEASNIVLKWSSNNESCATVDQNGLVTALTAGIVKITAAATDESGVFGEIELTITAVDQNNEPADGTEENESNDAADEPSKTLEEQLREEITLGGEIQCDDDISLSTDLTIPDGTQLTLSGKLTIPETLTLTNRGTMILKSTADIYGVLDNRETGVIEFSPVNPEKEAITFLSPVDHPNSELRNAGIINLHGNLVIESPESFSNDQEPIILFDGGTLSGSSNFVLSSNAALDSENNSTLLGTPLKEYIDSLSGSQIIEVNGDFVIDQPFTIEAGKILKIASGTVTIAQNAALVNEGCLEISGGTLVVQEGALLDNQCFINVNDSGCLNIMELGTYRSSKDAILQLNQASVGTSASITGISPSEIECSVLAESLNQLKSMLRIEGYRFLTVYVNDADMLNRTDLSIPANKAISTLP